MKRSWLLSLLITSFTTSLFAGDDWVYYVGGAAGSTFKESDVESGFNPNRFQFADITQVQTLNSTDFSPAGQLQFGVGYKEDDFYLGGEIVGQFFDGGFDPIQEGLNQSGVMGETRTDLSLRDFEIAFDLKPGIYLFDETLLYARIGFGINRLKLENFTSSEGSAGVYASIFTESETSRDVYPFRLGFGLEREYMEDVTLFIDYVYSRYATISTESEIEQSNQTLVSVAEATGIHRQSVQLGVNYYF